MPILENPRHELFCQLRATGKSATAAYVDAGYSENGARQSAHKLLTNSDIKARIEELRAGLTERAIEKTALTESYVINRLMRITELTSNPQSEKWNPNAAVRALELLGKKLGLWITRVDHRQPIQVFTSLEEVEAAYAENEREIEALLERKRQLLAKDYPEDGEGTVH